MGVPVQAFPILRLFICFGFGLAVVSHLDEFQYDTVERNRTDGAVNGGNMNELLGHVY